MKKRSIRSRISYWFDCVMSKGPIAMCGLLLAITAAIVGSIGIVAYFVADDGGIFFQLWSSLMYTLDAGNLAGVPTENIVYLALMFLATLCGLFLTSVLIGIISTGVEGKLSELRKGTSVVQEDGHTVIIGFDGNIYDLLRELIEANSNHKDACIVVLGRQSKECMEDDIAAHIPDTGTTRIICRSGGLHEGVCLERCSIETCRSVIVNVYDDAETVKVLLALSAHIKDRKLLYPQLRFVITLQDDQFLEAARIAGEGRAKIVFVKDAIARIISNTCRQHGLSRVLTELFNFSGSEIYFESIPEVEGKTFKEASMQFANAVVLGLCSHGEVQVNPAMDTVIGKEHQLILLEMDDGEFELTKPKAPQEKKICNGKAETARASEHLVVLGSNDKLPISLREYDKYVKPGTNVLILDDDLEREKLGQFQNLEITICGEPINRELLVRVLDKDNNNILLLNDDSQEPEKSDSLTLLRLILLRDVADKTNRHFSITTEMRSVDNQRLAAQARVDDFVIGSNFTSLLMVQISENPLIEPVIRELLDEEGSELYMKDVENYVHTGVEVDFYTLSESALRKGEICVGYRCFGKGKGAVVVNPRKTDTMTFRRGDQVVVIAES